MSVRPGSGMRRLLSNPILVSVSSQDRMILDSLGEIQRYGTVLENREQKQESYIVSGECSERIVKKYNLKLYTQGFFQALGYSIDSMTYDRKQNVVANKQGSMILRRLNDMVKSNKYRLHLLLLKTFKSGSCRAQSRSERRFRTNR